MDGGLRLLVAATCFVVIGGVAYFIAADWADRPSASDRALQQHRDFIERVDAFEESRQRKN